MQSCNFRRLCRVMLRHPTRHCGTGAYLCTQQQDKSWSISYLYKYIYIPGFDIWNVEIRGAFNKGIWHIGCLCCELQVGFWLISQYITIYIYIQYIFLLFRGIIIYIYKYINTYYMPFLYIRSAVAQPSIFKIAGGCTEWCFCERRGLGTKGCESCSLRIAALRNVHKYIYI